MQKEESNVWKKRTDDFMSAYTFPRSPLQPIMVMMMMPPCISYPVCLKKKKEIEFSEKH